MRHRVRGRHLGRNPAHRKAMFRNMASSLIRSVRVDEDDRNAPKTPGRIVTTLPKAKALRPFVEKLITMARKALVHEENASEFETQADRNSAEWKSWRESEQWNNWNQAIAPAVALRRRAFALLRDDKAVDVLFDELAERFEDRPGGYTRIVRLASVRLGDSGQQAMIEFVGENDRVKTKRVTPVVEAEEQPVATQAAEEVEAADASEHAEDAETTNADAEAETESAEETANDSTEDQEKH